MTIPRDYYYIETTTQTQFTENPTGNLSVNQLLHGQAPWILPNPRNTKKKELILSDWTFRNWSDEKKKLAVAKFHELLDEGFSIYVQDNHQIKPFTQNDLSKLNDSSFISPPFSQKISS